MRKLVLTVCTLCLSVGAFAVTTSTQQMSISAQQVGSSIKNAVQNHAANPAQSSLVYGGRDISRSLVATANESVWSGQEAVIG